MARGQNMEGERMAAECDFDVVRDAIKILDSCGKKGIRSLGISHLRAASTGKLDAFGSVFFDELLLIPSEERFCMGQHLRVFDVAVADRTVTDEEDDVVPFILAHGRKILLGAKLDEEIDAVKPLLDGIIPGIQAKVAFHDLFGKA